MKKNAFNPFGSNYACRLPENLDLDKILQEHPFTPSFHKGNPIAIKDRLALVLDMLMSSLSIQWSQGEDKDCYANLCSAILQDLVRDYNRYLAYAVEVGIIEKGENYIVGQKCTSYRFTEVYRTSRRLRDQYIYETVLVKKIWSHIRDLEAIKKYQHLFDQLYHLSVDWLEAEEILKKLYGKDEFRKKELQRDTLRRLEDPERWTFKTGETGRLYTPISNLNKKLRKALRYNGEPLVGLDIKNSIPYFSLALFDAANYRRLGIEELIFKNNDRLRRRYDRYDEDKEREEKGEGRTRKTHPLVMLVDFQNELDEIPDLKEFVELVKSGELYELLMVLFNIPDRTEAKKKFLAILNAPSHWESQRRESLVIRFPRLMKVIELLNEGYYKTKKGIGKGETKIKWQPGDQVCTFAYVTQQLEARFVLDVVCKAIEEEHPEVPMLTLHDCIFTTPEYFRLVHSYMARLAIEFMGFAPRIEVK